MPYDTSKEIPCLNEFLSPFPHQIFNLSWTPNGISFYNTARFSRFIDSLSTPIGVLNYVSLFTLSILNISLRIGAKNLGLLISTTFIKIPLSSTAHYSENDYYNRKYSCYPNSRTAASNDATDTESYPQIIPSAHFFHIVNTSFAVFTIFYSKAY